MFIQRYYFLRNKYTF